MKRLTVILALALVAGCSGGEGADPAASETGSAATATDSAASTETPMTADRCIEDNKGLGTGTRGEATKDCMITACDQGDKKSCNVVKSFESGDHPENEPPADEPDDE
jgi:hypothetical protein